LKIKKDNVKEMFSRSRIVITNHLLKISNNYFKMSNKTIRIGVCQLNTRDDKEANLKIGEQLIIKGAQDQAKVSFIYYLNQLFE
jgi:hypothetical protein